MTVFSLKGVQKGARELQDVHPFAIDKVKDINYIASRFSLSSKKLQNSTRAIFDVAEISST